MKTIKVEETKYVREINSKAILNTNRNALENYKLAKKRKEQEISDINNIKQDILELKELVKKLIKKK
jgi:hypothetical protein